MFIWRFDPYVLDSLLSISVSEALGLRGAERYLVLALWVSFFCAILVILRRALRLGIDSLKIILSTGLISTLGKGAAIGSDTPLGFILVHATAFLSMISASKMLERSRIFRCVISDVGWVGGGVGGSSIMLNRYWVVLISISVADG